MSTPVVVQGRPVSNPGGGDNFGSALGGGSAPPTTVDGITNYADKGVVQEVRCRDPVFALLFYATVAAILVVAIIYGPDALNEDNNTSDRDYEGYVYASIIMAFLSFFVSAGGVSILMCIPETLIKVSLIFVVVLAGVWMVMAFLAGSIGLGILGIFFFAISVCYAYCVWSRIPFATIVRSSWTQNSYVQLSHSFSHTVLNYVVSQNIRIS